MRRSWSARLIAAKGMERAELRLAARSNTRFLANWKVALPFSFSKNGHWQGYLKPSLSSEVRELLLKDVSGSNGAIKDSAVISGFRHTCHCSKTWGVSKEVAGAGACPGEWKWKRFISHLEPSWTCPNRQFWKIMVARKNIDLLGPVQSLLFATVKTCIAVCQLILKEQ